MNRIIRLSTVFIMIAVSWGCGFRSSDDAEIELSKSEVGTPNGAATTKSIGPTGGSIASSDGRINVKVAPNTVTAPVEFSIQPITNQAQGGLGNAYRLEPNGQKFTTPVEVSFKYTEQDLEGTVPEAFTIAYQDANGVWQGLPTKIIDPASKTVTVSTAHFTDFSLWTFSLSPAKATLHVGETQVIALVGCYRTNSVLNTLKRLAGREPSLCASANARDSSSWAANFGTISPTGDSKNSVAIYTAPAKKPSPNVDKVRFVYTLRFADGITDVRTAEITIVDNSYKVSGGAGDTVFSGVVCDIEKPFTLKTNNPFLGAFNFVPGNTTAGKWNFATKNGVSGGGKGQYTIEGNDTEKTAISMSGFSTGCISVGCRSGGGDVRLTLTPLDTSECN